MCANIRGRHVVCMSITEREWEWEGTITGGNLYRGRILDKCPGKSSAWE